MQRGVAMRVDRAEGAASVEHQFGDVHAARVRRPVETHVELLKGRQTDTSSCAGGTGNQQMNEQMEN